MMVGLLHGVSKRRLLPVLDDLVQDEPVIALHGPRSVGKSTLLQAFAAARGVPVVDLEMRDVALANPALVVGGAAPVCLDEYQRAPELLDALKARLNREGSLPGTAVLTGSTRHDAIPRTAQALTGRLHVVTILPLSQGEIDGKREDLLPVLRSDPVAAVAEHPSSTTTRAQYAQRVCAGGFPLALRRSGPPRARWFDDYVHLAVERDALKLARIRQRQVLRALLDRLVGQTAQVLNLAAAGAGLDAEYKTLEAHARLLEDLFLVQRLPAWGTTLRARATRRPKVHVVHTGLGARLLRVSETRLASLDPTVLTEFGHLLETFVVNELRKQVSWLDEPVTVGHWRTHDGDEVDFVIEYGDGQVLAFEVKASERVSGADLQGLRKLRQALGDRFVAGVAFSTGRRSYTHEDRLHVLPVDRLWKPVNGQPS